MSGVKTPRVVATSTTARPIWTRGTFSREWGSLERTIRQLRRDVAK